MAAQLFGNNTARIPLINLSYNKNMRHFYSLFVALLLISSEIFSQTSTEFWFAPPMITRSHGSPLDSLKKQLRFASGATAATIVISQPSNSAVFNGGVPITINLPANSAVTQNMTAFANGNPDILETFPVNTVNNNGLKITSTTPVTAYYEVNSANNPDIWALKGTTGLGVEFYTPFQNLWNNGNYGAGSAERAYTSFDIVATQNATTVLIYPSVALDGPRPAFTSYSITLNAGQTYSGSTGTNPENFTGPNPSGTIITSNKPIAVSIKDDSVNPTGYGCGDLQGDQLVPTDIVGKDYIVVKGGLFDSTNARPVTMENAFVVATANNTVLTIDGVVSGLPMFNGETRRVRIKNPSYFISASKPVYVMHNTGFGCEIGAAILPPLNCAGSQNINFIRSTAETFGLTVLIKTGGQAGFTIDGLSWKLKASDFSPVPGSAGAWVYARKSFSATLGDSTYLAVNVRHVISNSLDVFALGIINGGPTSGCRYGYFSEFAAPITINAGADANVCANDTIDLNGLVTGGATTGKWTVPGGTGVFIPNFNTLNAKYVPSLADISGGTLNFTLTSTGQCNPVTDQVLFTFNPKPVVNAGADKTVCKNNAVVFLFPGTSVTVASGSIWSGGTGVYLPNTINAAGVNYTPSAAEIAAGTPVTLTLTSTGNGNCNPEKKQMIITFTNAPLVNAGPDVVACTTSPNTTLAGVVSGFPGLGGTWTVSPIGGSFSPNANTLNAIFTPTAGQIASGVTLTLTSTGNATCNAVTDQMLISYTPGPTSNAGVDQSICKNNANTTLAGIIGGSATGGVWSTSGTGSFTPGTTTLGATYLPSASDLTAGTVSLTLTTTGGTCTAVNDLMVITFTNSPTVNAGLDKSVCKNNAAVSLFAGTSITVATGGVWSGGSGAFTPSTTNAAAVTYNPTPAEITAGTPITLTLTTSGNGNCSSVTDQMVVSFTNAPSVNAGLDVVGCTNAPATTLAGVVSGFFGLGGSWTVSPAGGTFSPDANTLNAVFNPTVAQISSGVTLTLTSTGNATCNAVNDQMLISYVPGPTVNAGVDQTICKNNAVTTLAGIIGGSATGGTWSTSGSGSFNPGTTTLNANYTPSLSDLTAGSVTLTLTTTGGACPAVNDAMVITFTNPPAVNAGIDRTACGNNAVVTLAGVVTPANASTWTGGAGTFSNVNSLTSTYTPTAAEVTAGTVTLTLSSTLGNCAAVIDNMVITYTASPTANAGVDKSICRNNTLVTLNGTSITGATGVQWSGGTGTFANANAVNTTYTPSAGDLSLSTLTLTLSTTGALNGCNNVSDQVLITFTDPPIVSASVDRTACANNAVVDLGTSSPVPSFSGSTGVIWSGGLGSYSAQTSVSTTYTPTAGELSAGFVNLTLTTTGNGTCSAVADVMTITYTASPTINAGVDILTGSNNPTVSLSGTGSNYTGLVWSTAGTGTFSSTTILNPTYTLSAADITAGTVTLTLLGNGTGCNPVTDFLVITITACPTVNAGIDQTLCSNNPNANLSATLTNANASTGVLWSGGTGTYASTTTLNTSYNPSAADIAAGFVDLTVTTTGNVQCTPATDVVRIIFSPAPVVNAGPDATRCANNATIALGTNGATVSAPFGRNWSGGAGAFTPSNSAVNATYTPTAAEITAGTVTLTLTSSINGNCNAVNDQITITFTPAATVNAGADFSICLNNTNNIPLSGSVTGGGFGGIWTGNGAFTNATNPSTATYTPTPAERTAGSATLTLTSTTNGTCNPVTDVMVITFTPAHTVNAGPDKTICKNNPIVNLADIAVAVTGASGAIWSGGAGTFTSPANLNSASYAPTAAELAAGTVTLTLTTTGFGTCAAVSDFIIVTFTDSPLVNAGPDASRCANNASVILQVNGATVSSPFTGVWSGGGGSFAPNANTVNATYTPSAAEIASGSATLTLTSASNGNCTPVNDQIIITYTPAPVVNAGADFSICLNNSTNIPLSGSVTGGGFGGIWTGNGTFTNANSPATATYTPTNAERTAGSATITLTSTANGTCNPVADAVIITFTPAHTVNAGPDKTICKNNPLVSLADVSVAVTGASGAIWSGGAGTFTSPANLTSASYTPTAGELTSGTVTLTLTTTGFGTCSAVSDFIVVTFINSPVVNAGTDKTVCANNSTVSLSAGASISSPFTVIWSGGAGTFANPTNLATATYSPTASEISSGTVTLTLTSTSNGNCNAVNDQMTITFTPAPTVNAGADLTICQNNSAINLGPIGAITVATDGAWTTNPVGGTFTPSNLESGNPSFAPSAGQLSAGTFTLTLTSVGNGNCNAVTDVVTVTVAPTPVVNAGVDQTVCRNNPSIVFAGASSSTTTGVWTSLSGTPGTFSNAFLINGATYSPSATELLGSSVTLQLTSTNNASCNAVFDVMVINFTNAPIVNAGVDQSICKNNTLTTLAATVSGGVPQWISGLGTFSNINSLTSTYAPTAGEVSAGFVNLILQSTLSGCSVVKDTVRINFTNAPTVNAGIDKTVCSNSALVTLNDGSVTAPATGGVWTSSGTGSFANATSIITTYNPSAADIAAGTVTLTLSTSGATGCNPVTDNLVVTITLSAAVNAGPDQTTCGNAGIFGLSGASISAAPGGVWTSNGTGLITNPTSVTSASYTPSAADILSGTVTLTLTSTGGSCPSSFDTKTITINPAPTVNAGVDLVRCGNNAAAAIDATVTNAASVTWSGGLGSYAPNNSTVDLTSYTATPGEVTSGTVTLTLTASQPGCNAVVDQMTISYSPSPTVNAGIDRTICQNNTNVPLTGVGTITIASGGVWTATPAGGTFNPNANFGSEIGRAHV